MNKLKTLLSYMRLNVFLPYIKALSNQTIRRIVQAFFLFIILSIGYHFYRFVQYCESGGIGSFFERPPGVEAFLPISSLISLKYFFLTGEINPIHPSGLVILIAIIAVSLLLKKGFCGWICPVGLLSEFLWRFGAKALGRNPQIPFWLDSILRSLKYLILIFFLWAIFIQMNLESIRSFINSPYNKVADVKMLFFFTDISALTIYVLLILIVLSIPFKNFWCRYLCPYGALLGFISIFSPFKVTRNEESCINCNKCTKSCPEFIQIHKKRRIYSDECMACLACIEVCPEENTLDFKLAWSKIKLTGYSFAIAFILLYFSFVYAGKITGNWSNSISTNEYITRIQDINNNIYDHNRGKVAPDNAVPKP